MGLGFIQPYFDLFCVVLWLFFRTWWWVIVPCLLYFPAKALYLWWVQWDVEYAGLEWIVLEIIPPGEVEKPFRAMEDIFSTLWTVYDSGNWRELWCEGMLPQGPYWFSFEIVSKAGEIHFYMRTMKETEKFVKGIFHAHYPEAEIVQVDDYVKNVPQDIPNKTYNLFHEILCAARPSSYPIKTYKFFEIRPEEVEEEKRIDPMYHLMEDMAILKEGEELWFQIGLTPVAEEDNNWITEGRKLADKLAKRPESAARKSMLGEAWRYLVFLKKPYATEEEKAAFLPPEMKLTPGEKNVVTAVEEKISKKGYVVFARAFYIYKQEAYFSPNKRIPRSYFAHFNTEDMNFIRDTRITKTRIHYLFRKRRMYARQRDAFEKTINRFPPLFPDRMGKDTATMVLNAEELATIFHFPMRPAGLPPGVPRIAAKKGGPPPGIPTE